MTTAACPESRVAQARTRFQFLAVLFAALASQLLVVAPAWAQGTMGTVPDPISASELDDYARRLGLSAQQRVALEQFHEQYREAFSALRDGEIEKYLNDNPLAGAGGGRGGQGGGGRGGRGGQGGGNAIGLMMGGVDAQAVKDSLKQLESIINKIKALDNTLFDQIQGLLTEEQALLMSGVRQARERERYRTGVSRMTAFTNPGTTVDLSAMVTNLTLSPDERTNVTPLVSAYESSLTSAVRKLHDSANDATVEMAEKMTALSTQNNAAGNAGGGGRRGGGGDDRRMDGFRQVWGEIMLRMNEKAAEITELNRRTERSLNAVLAPTNARRLRSEFYNRAYPEMRGSTSVTRAFETALTFEDLTQEQRDAIAAMHDQYVATLDSINTEMADLIDEQRKTQTFFNWDDERRRAHEDKMNSLREKRNGLGDSARAQASATLGPELTEQLEQRVAEARERQREERTGTVVTMVAPAMGAAGVAPGAVMRFEGTIEGLTVAGADLNADPFVPAAISTRDLDTYAKRLKLDDDQRALLSGLHTDYMDQYRMIEETQIKAVRDAEQGLWAEGPDGERQPPSPEMIDNLYALRRQTIESIKTIDGLFFENVQLALLDDGGKPGLERVHNARLRSVYNRGAGSQGMFTAAGGPGGRRGGGPQRTAMFFNGPGGGSSEAGIDLSVLVEQTDITPSDPQQLDTVLAEYEVAATGAFQTLFDTSMRMRAAMDKVTTQFARGGGRGRDTTVQINGDAMRQAAEGDGRAAREARDTMVNLNRSTLERVTGVLESRSASDLQQAYNRKAFPDVFRDPRSAEPRIDAALALTDLSDSQRDQVQGIAAEFHDAYANLCNQLIDLERNAPAMGGPGSGGGFDVQAFQERMRNREKIEFERTDLSDRMLARLRGTLSPEQGQRIGLENAGS